MEIGDITARPARPVWLALSLTVALAAAGCTTEAEKAATPPPPAAVQIGQENVVSVTPGTIVVGPILSGELRAQREATIRAELGGSMLEVRAEEGQSVARGALLGRIETRTLDDARQSATSAVHNAESQLAVARREVERTEQLVTAAITAFSDTGYAGTSTDDIARLAGVSQPYVIRLFGSKQRLFLAGYMCAADQIEEAFRAA